MRNKFQLCTVLTVGLALSAPLFADGLGMGGEMPVNPERMARMVERYDSNGDGMVSPEEIQAVRAAEFKTADTNQDGVLSLQELQAHKQNKRTEKTNRHFSALDKDNNQQLSVEEFQSSRRAAKNPAAAASLFGLADTDGSNSLSLSEFTLLRSPEGRMWRRFAKTDSNGDGLISEAEFTQAMQHRCKGKGKHRHH